MGYWREIYPRGHFRERAEKTEQKDELGDWESNVSIAGGCRDCGWQRKKRDLRYFTILPIILTF